MLSSCAWWHKCTHIQITRCEPTDHPHLRSFRRKGELAQGSENSLESWFSFHLRVSASLVASAFTHWAPLLAQCSLFVLQFFQECRGLTQRSAGQWESVWEGVMPLASAVRLNRIASSCSGGPDGAWGLERKVIWVLCKAKGREKRSRF